MCWFTKVYIQYTVHWKRETISAVCQIKSSSDVMCLCVCVVVLHTRIVVVLYRNGHFPVCVTCNATLGRRGAAVDHLVTTATNNPNGFVLIGLIWLTSHPCGIVNLGWDLNLWPWGWTNTVDGATYWTTELLFTRSNPQNVLTTTTGAARSCTFIISVALRLRRNRM